MFPIWIALFFGAIFAAYTTAHVPKEMQHIERVKANVQAANFVSYRKAVIQYLAANPGVSGDIPDTAIDIFKEPGFVKNPAWKSYAQGAQLFVYSNAPVAKTLAHEIFSRSSNNPLVGIKSATGKLVSFKGADTGISLPSVIPGNAIVVAGK